MINKKNDAGTNHIRERKPLPRPKSHEWMWIAFHWRQFFTGETLSPGLTLKRAPRSSRIAPLDRRLKLPISKNSTVTFYCNFLSLTILCWNENDLAGRLWPLNDSEDQSGSPPKWNQLETGPRPNFGKNVM